MRSDGVRPNGGCSTPCGIRGFCTSAQKCVSMVGGWCSTPCGIRGFCTFVCLRATRRHDRCSTPCGIRGFCTICRSSPRPTCPSAQRLAASEVFAPYLRSLIVWRRVRVLNALRHQRFLHWAGQMMTRLRTCAQRLAASEVFARFADRHHALPAQVLNALRHQRFLHRT